MKQRSDRHRGHSILVFEHKHTAERTVRALLDAGISSERIGFFVRATPAPRISDAEFEQVSNFGGSVGAGLGAIAGLALFAIPGLGPVLGTGRIAAALTGTVLGSSVGGLGGALAGAGLSEADAALAEHHLREGKAVVVVQTAGDQSKLSAIARAQGSVEVANVENSTGTSA